MTAETPRTAETAETAQTPQTAETDLSYAHGVGTAPLLGDTIGRNLDRAIAAHPDREALLDLPAGIRHTGIMAGSPCPIWSGAPAPSDGCCRMSRSRSSPR
ncbi:hypothetical protein [Streptomyces sp. PR69]|uniref:hypothetical protein n=1 Tax=Streptomyces sp. PR69 TaxID=2984950 RepID=UPI0022654C9E|nr:hypothetical protein [Streptomyces sp. PR69]